MPTDLRTTPLHLGPGGTIAPFDGFDWAKIDDYVTATEADGADGRMVMLFDFAGSWENWEQHPVGDEAVVCISGRHRFFQEVDGETIEVVLGPGEALVNGPGIWHTCDTLEPGTVLTITSGLGTTHRPR